MPKQPPQPDHGDFAHDPQEDVPVQDWIPHPVSDSSDYLDRPAPQYLEAPSEDLGQEQA
jgi:hypothetical protein